MTATERKSKNGQTRSNGHMLLLESEYVPEFRPDNCAVIYEALRIVKAQPEPTDEQEVIRRLELVRQVIADNGVKAAREDRHGLDSAVMQLAMKVTWSVEARILNTEIIDLLTPERKPRRKVNVEDYLLLELTDEQWEEIIAAENAKGEHE